MKRLVSGPIGDTKDAVIYSTEIPAELNHISDLEEFIYHCDSSNFEIFTTQIMQILDERPNNVNFALRCIKCALNKRPRLTYTLIQLFHQIEDKYPHEHMINIDQIVIPEENTPWNCIFRDDIDNFQLISSYNEFDFNQRNNDDINLLEYAAKIGSVSCFKFILLNNAKFNYRIAHCAIQGGEYEIIRILQQKGINFDSCLGTALEYRRNRIADFILENYKQERVTVAECLLFFNIKAAIFYINSGFKLAETYNAYTPLAACVENENVDMVKYLMKQRVDVNTGKSNGGGGFAFGAFAQNTEVSPLYLAIERRNMELFNYLIEHGADVNKGYAQTGGDGFGLSYTEISPIYYACENNLIEVVKTLLEKRADVTKGYKYYGSRPQVNRSPLQIAEMKHNQEIVDILNQKLKN